MNFTISTMKVVNPGSAAPKGLRRSLELKEIKISLHKNQKVFILLSTFSLIIWNQHYKKSLQAE